ncbi:N-6 DNA methylase (plasmid) [Burkholderia cenocepacia]|uniref:N-6 DNA methylase n=1 Tax=Burkholderia cenocepacia TaxID=95486 RepID=UPI0020A08650|nr:N-6 DNA methylase [Burkholderia cenocepacia]MCO8402841.1 N-6 DNA methylase [Burkholderia cenocepacia]MCO8415080.1 N-6 DNA methylase [Burkholderia cenocepacia]MCO8423121.1 N-6 DNA methylase [Burkholderia cenocepacia]MCO8474827.1 N-6 DNA methylase [Burkholderia cenocepacia]MCO8481993.1 N-6 DNA methylase [Burkholderia cenocepacia]
MRSLENSINTLGRKYSVERVFSDFVELAALAISNSVDRQHFDTREERYLVLIRGYTREEANQFAHMLSDLTLSLEAALAVDGPCDLLGPLFMRLDIRSRSAGQFFTPFEISKLMARLQLGDGHDIRAREFVTVCEPACGAGGMIIAFANALAEIKIDYQHAMHAVCRDIDLRCVHMAYVQLALLNIPAVVIHGNGLTDECRSAWATPAHVLGGWNTKLQRRHEAPPQDPAPRAIRPTFQSRLRNFLKVKL